MANNNTKAKRLKLAKAMGRARMERRKAEAETAKRKADEAAAAANEIPVLDENCELIIIDQTPQRWAERVPSKSI